jgi:hypothetical protein
MGRGFEATREHTEKIRAHDHHHVGGTYREVFALLIADRDLKPLRHTHGCEYDWPSTSCQGCRSWPIQGHHLGPADRARPFRPSI